MNTTRMTNGKERQETVTRYQHDYAEYVLNSDKQVKSNDSMWKTAILLTTLLVMAVLTYGFASLLAVAVNVYK